MSNRRFHCGHQGKGRTCHRCKQADEAAGFGMWDLSAKLRSREKVPKDWMEELTKRRHAAWREAQALRFQAELLEYDERWNTDDPIFEDENWPEY